jgi:hypothetical protein
VGSNPTEPPNYTVSYTTAKKEIVDTEIEMHQSAGTVINTVTTAPRTIIITATQMLLLLKLTVTEEQEKGSSAASDFPMLNLMILYDNLEDVDAFKINGKVSEVSVEGGDNTSTTL